MIPAFARTKRWMLVAVSGTALIVASSATAQEAASSFDQLRGLVKPGDTVYVTDVAGRTTKGRLGELSASSLELLVRETRRDRSEVFVARPRMSELEVKEIVIERRDSPLDGTLIGLTVGALPGIVFAVGRSQGSDPLGGAATPFIGIPGAIGALVGGLIDKSIYKQWTVYKASRQPSSTLRISSLVSKSRAGAQMSIRF